MASDETVAVEQSRGRPAPETVALIVLAVVAVGGVITYLGPILKPFLIAVFLFYATRSAAQALIRRGFPTWLAYLSLFVAAVSVMIVLTLFVYSEALDLREDWEKRYYPRIHAFIGKEDTGLGHSLEEILKDSSRDVFAYIYHAGMGSLEQLIMTFFYLLFLLLGASKLPGRVQRAFAGEGAERILTIGQRISTGMEQFMKVKTLVSIGMGASAAALMAVFGLEHWVLWGFLFFALNYITYIGSIAACVPPIVLAFLEMNSTVAATALAVLIVLNRFLWIDYIEIRLSGKQLNIDSVLLFLWLAYWGWAWGVLGLILAYPMLVSLKIVLEHVEASKGWAVLMSEE
jgi:AI-2 transport protein TqsA